MKHLNELRHWEGMSAFRCFWTSVESFAPVELPRFIALYKELSEEPEGPWTFVADG